MNYRLTIHRQSDKSDNFSVNGYDEIYANSLVELLSKLMIVVIGIQKSNDKEELDAWRAKIGDDIPF